MTVHRGFSLTPALSRRERETWWPGIAESKPIDAHLPFSSLVISWPGSDWMEQA
jgi:hypothetical protein